jgi:hypothetical protein
MLLMTDEREMVVVRVIVAFIEIDHGAVMLALLLCGCCGERDMFREGRGERVGGGECTPLWWFLSDHLIVKKSKGS